ncbi:uncharacterized protein LOC127867462 [Dreissena polymorpha]|uniref:Uncharacterized protein n=1 Tax=Dreissena polymorpha TaxID=45954 RepID=A0A9D4M0K4_DREPO|nr:uncharacterized protein LOC127867462 [Dreissena polymorpha]KAH3867144.1 hypothetical protein DPMN_030269 [Dreissena polymorpha]
MGGTQSKLAPNKDGDSDINEPLVSNKFELKTNKKDGSKNYKIKSSFTETENLISNNGSPAKPKPARCKFFKLVNRSYDVDANWSDGPADNIATKDLELLPEVELPKLDSMRYTRHLADDTCRGKWKQAGDAGCLSTDVIKKTKHYNQGEGFNVELDDHRPPSVHTPLRFLVNKSHDFRINDYTCQEKCMMAEIMRQNILDERVAKAAICDQRREEAALRRQQLLAEEKERQNQKMKNAHPAAAEQERRLQILTQNTKRARVAALKKNPNI